MKIKLDLEETENDESDATFTSEFMPGFDQWKNTEFIEKTDIVIKNALVIDDDEQNFDPFNPDHQEALITNNFKGGPEEQVIQLTDID